MINITIPPEALKAAARALREFYSDEPVSVCDGVSYKAARAACLSILNAWPGAFQTTTQINRDATEVLILPLPTENTNDQA